MSPQPMPQPAPAQAFSIQDATTIIQLLQNGQFGFNLRQSQDVQKLLERFADFARAHLEPTLPPNMIPVTKVVPAGNTDQGINETTEAAPAE